MKTLTQTIRNTGICLITAVVIIAPGIAHAGWLGSPKPVLNKVTQTVRTGISSVQNQVTQTVSTGVSNIQGNADGIGGFIRSNQPADLTLREDYAGNP